MLQDNGFFFLFCRDLPEPEQLPETPAADFVSDIVCGSTSSTSDK